MTLSYNAFKVVAFYDLPVVGWITALVEVVLEAAKTFRLPMIKLFVPRISIFLRASVSHEYHDGVIGLR